MSSQPLGDLTVRYLDGTKTRPAYASMLAAIGSREKSRNHQIKTQKE
jgi:hypothetical protein